MILPQITPLAPTTRSPVDANTPLKEPSTRRSRSKESVPCQFVGNMTVPPGHEKGGVFELLLVMAGRSPEEFMLVSIPYGRKV